MTQNKQVKITTYWYKPNTSDYLKKIKKTDLIDKFNFDITIFENNLVEGILEDINFDKFPKSRCNVSVFFDDVNSDVVSGDCKIDIFISNTFFTTMALSFFRIEKQKRI